jgi:hypothetical protein
MPWLTRFGQRVPSAFEWIQQLVIPSGARDLTIEAENTLSGLYDQ